MASIWKINGGDIYVSDYGEENDPNIVEINPINTSNSNYHWIFEPDMSVTVAGLVIGSGYKDTIQNGVGGNVLLITDLLPGGITVLLRDFKAERQQVICQYVDPLQPVNAPVYQVTVTLRTPR